MTHKRETYGPGGSYHLFAGKDASKALGKSSLKEEDADPDYSDLPEAEMKVLNDWHAFFLCVSHTASHSCTRANIVRYTGNDTMSLERSATCLLRCGPGSMYLMVRISYGTT